MRVCLKGALVCAAALWAGGPPRAEPLPPPQVSAVPIPDGQVTMAIGRLDGVIEEVLARTDIPGVAVAVVHDGEVTYVKGFGVREASKPEMVDADTVFQLASVSKSVGATVVAAQVAAGKVDWTTPVSGLLPWFQLADPATTRMLTVGDLYAHRSGLPLHAGDDLEDLGYDRRVILERMRLLPLESFRDAYAYTNFGLTAAAEAVAAAARMDWEALSEETIYRPLGMDRTSSRFADYIAHTNRAVPHVKVGQAWLPRHQRQPDAQTAAGGVSSSANDMAKWMLMVQAEGTTEGLLPALSPQAVSMPPYAPDARASFYGFGFGVGVSPSGRVTFSHSGAFALGAATNFVLIPSAGVGIAVLSNASPIGAVEAIALSFTDLVQFGQVERDWFAALEPRFAPVLVPFGRLAGKEPPAEPMAPRPLEDYAGAYGNDYFGPLELRMEGEALTMSAGPAGASWPLTHWNGDVFVFEPRGENATEGSVSEVAFAIGAHGVKAVTVEFWNKNGLGTFTR
jgi:CubicO group peptidase (beta-lactamase class C family)